MAHFLRFPQELDARLNRLAERTGFSRGELIERLVHEGVAQMESDLMFEEAPYRSPAKASIDQLLRESGLGI